VTLGFLAQEWSELGEVALDDFDDESFGELLVLVVKPAAGSDSVANEEEYAGRVGVDEALEGVHEVLRRARLPERREERKERFRVRVELLGGQEGSLVALVLDGRRPRRLPAIDEARGQSGGVCAPRATPHGT
jgi:hypothetical protein